MRGAAWRHAPHKVAAIAEAGRELLRNPSAEQLIQAILLKASAATIDGALFSNAAASAERPAGLLHNIVPLSSTGDLTNDLITLLASIAPVSGNGSVAIVASPRQAAAINLLPRVSYPILTSASLPTGTIVAVALSALVSAMIAPQIESSTQAVLHEEGTQPATDLGGGVTARPIRSLFQTDVVGLRLKWPVYGACAIRAGSPGCKDYSNEES